ncbi:serine/threonine-protein kinase [Actinomadura sp. NPDC049753]|uniref:WD40 repeat domain-containing serine/threonine protein kinase n=1 Tax=Actinomadura sp. NPDC049753 TaxID=3154739 RepID=UPI003437B319
MARRAWSRGASVYRPPPAPTLVDPATSAAAAADGVTEEWAVGDRILDLYEVRELYGDGGMGLVYRVRHLGWDIDLAVKCPRPDMLASEGLVRLFVQEAETWVALGLHPNICTCHYVQTLGAVPRVFAEFVDGGSLRQWIRGGRLYEGGPRAALERILDVAIQTAWGLAHAHRLGVVHQDVKPANVLLDSAGNAKVSDFGLARAGELMAGRSSAEPGDGTLLVTTGGLSPAYASPEQAARRPLGRRADVYSFAVSVLEMFTGRVRWRLGPAAGTGLARYLDGQNPDAPMGAMPAGLADLLARCLRDEPEHRPRAMASVAAELVSLYEAEFETPYPRALPRTAELRANELNNRALSLLDLGRPEEAAAAFREARAADPRHPEVIYNSGLLRWRAAGVTDADLTAELESVRRDDPERVGRLLRLVDCERGDTEVREERGADVETEDEEDTEFRAEVEEDVEFDTPGNETVFALCPTPDGRHVVGAGSSGRLLVWELDTGRRVRIIPTDNWVISQLCVTRDGRHALAGKNSLQAWDLVTGERTGPWRGRKSGTDAICLTPDGAFALTAGRRDSIHLWEVATLRRVRTMPGLRDENGHSVMKAVCVSPDGRHALSAHRGPRLCLWDLVTGQTVWTTKIPEKTGGRLLHDASLVHVTPDGRHAVAAFPRGVVVTLDMATGRVARTFADPSSHELKRMCVTPDGRHLVMIDGVLRLWELETWRCIRTMSAPPDPRSVCAAPDGRRVVIGPGHGRPRVVDLGRRRPAPLQICRPRSHGELSGLDSRVRAQVAEAERQIDARRYTEAAAMLERLRSEPDLGGSAPALDAWHRLALVSTRAGVRASWQLGTLAVHAGPVTCLEVTPDGERAVSAGADGAVRVWDVATRRLVHRLVEESPGVRACLTPDGHRCVTSSSGEELNVWDLAAGRLVRTLRTGASGRGRLVAVCASPDGRHVITAGAAGGDGEEIRLWNIESGRTAILHGGREGGPGIPPARGVTALTVTPDGRHLIIGGRNEVWDLFGDAEATARIWPDGAAGVGMTRDGRHVLGVSAGFSGDVRSEDSMLFLRRLGNVSIVGAYGTGVTAACAMVNGRWGLTGSANGAVTMWDLRRRSSGEPHHVLADGGSEVALVRVTDAGRHVLAAGLDGTVRVWELDWELRVRDPSDWDDRARPFLTNFLTLRGLEGRAAPEWTEDDFDALCRELQYAGFGRLGRSGVRAELDRMAERWNGPPKPRFAWDRDRTT